MNKTREELIEECQHDIQKYEQWGKVLYDFSLSRIANLQIPIDGSTLHKGLEYGKAIMKLRTLRDNNHTEKEIEQRLKQIDVDVRFIEEAFKHDLDFHNLLIHI